MLFRALLALCAACIPFAAEAAASAVALTPQKLGVLGGDSRVFSARFFDAQGNPAVGENVQFLNDACGFFSNGSPVITVLTDSTGTASATFTARQQGITCWVVASAGAQVRWDVLTYTIGLVHLETSLSPPLPRPGEPFVLTVRPKAGPYPLYETDVTARVIAGSASAFLPIDTAGSGQGGSATFNVVPDHRVGDYEIEVAYRGLTKRVAMRAPQAPWQDMWWGGQAENGWGVSIVQHRDTLFSVIYAYDESGLPTWYVMPGGQWDEARTAFSGALYRPQGSPYDAYDADDFVVGEPVGSAKLNLVDGMHIALDYSIGATSARKSLTRQDIGLVDTPLPMNLADMWWGGAAQNGWGMAMLQQYRSLFTVWFTYDSTGAPTWFVMSSGFWSDASTYEGRIHRTTGAHWLGTAYDPRVFRATDVGAFRMRFAGETATFDYTIGGRSGTMPLSRQPF
ncbi:MAG TPA: Ig-like domain-containing protein [Usitatibacter sp.]|nr:Ig-like domain-containing protein [Usitatibacter sp.]